MPKSPQTLDPPPESHRRNGYAILSLVQGLGGKAGRGLATFEDYEAMLERRPDKFQPSQVRFVRGGGKTNPCSGCMHWYQSPIAQRSTCEVVRPDDDEGDGQVLAGDTCMLWTVDRENYPKLAGRSRRAKNG